MSEQKVYELDAEGNITGRIIPISQNPMYRRMKDLRKEKIEEIKIIMDKWLIDIDDLKGESNDQI